MTARAVFSEARLLKLLALAREQGLQPSTVRIERDGAIPPMGTQIIASLTFEEATALMDDMDETLADCLRRDGEAV